MLDDLPEGSPAPPPNTREDGFRIEGHDPGVERVVAVDGSTGRGLTVEVREA